MSIFRVISFYSPSSTLTWQLAFHGTKIVMKLAFKEQKTSRVDQISHYFFQVILTITVFLSKIISFQLIVFVKIVIQDNFNMHWRNYQNIWLLSTHILRKHSCNSQIIGRSSRYFSFQSLAATGILLILIFQKSLLCFFPRLLWQLSNNVKWRRVYWKVFNSYFRLSINFNIFRAQSKKRVSEGSEEKNGKVFVRWSSRSTTFWKSGISWRQVIIIVELKVS